MSNNKMNKNTIPEDFSLALALVDSVPVLFFGASAITIGAKFGSFIFIIGALLTFFAGASKVLWKIIVAVKKKNIWGLFIQMRILMPIGFALMLISAFLNKASIDIKYIWTLICAFPSALFFLIGVIGMSLMIIFSIVLDSSDLKSNWIEQITNGIAQFAIFIGILLS